MVQGPETRDMKPGYHPDGGEDLLRASLLYYYYLLYDVLMRPDYGHYQLSRDTSGAPFWEHTKEQYLEQGKPRALHPRRGGLGLHRPLGPAVGPAAVPRVPLSASAWRWTRLIALEVLSIPMALNTAAGPTRRPTATPSGAASGPTTASSSGTSCAA